MLTKPTNGMEEGEETQNYVEDPQDKFITMLLQEKNCYERNISEPNMQEKEHENKLGM